MPETPNLSFLILTYNQECFIREAMESALQQRVPPMEIIVSDDSSKDSTYEVMKAVAATYTGPHTLRLNRTAQNVGVIEHFNSVMGMARGDYFVLNAGDDISLPNRVERLSRVFRRIPRRGLSTFSNSIVIDAEGNRGETWLKPGERDVFRVEQFFMPNQFPWVLGFSHAFHRDLFDVFGPLNEEILQEDNILPARALLMGGICYIDEPLHLYRRHTTNTYQGNADPKVNPAYFQRMWRNRIAIYKQFLADVRRAYRLGIIGKRRLAYLQGMMTIGLEVQKLYLAGRRVPDSPTDWLTHNMMRVEYRLESIFRPAHKRLLPVVRAEVDQEIDWRLA